MWSMPLAVVSARLTDMHFGNGNRKTVPGNGFDAPAHVNLGGTSIFWGSSPVPGRGKSSKRIAAWKRNSSRNSVIRIT